MSLEMKLGYSHQCNGCGKIFLQHEDGCPNCGISASVSPLQQCPSVFEKMDPDDKDWYTMFFDEISNQIIILSANSSHEIRLRDGTGEEFIYWIVIIEGEPCYVFLNDAYPWPR
ncbi:MAG: hypothetical protein UR78_C0012G0011 [Candidatus Moranbacteria bacterium GW2011_GWF2_35_39]|nr:MAG: hypothetical protein UR78_C0012G0011 [Candidatus Moranbacteria bacterium GW2011_GWF2_35_39]